MPGTTPPFESLAAMRRMAVESIHPAEREAARAALDRLLAKYKLVESDLDSELREDRPFSVPAGDPWALKLAFQILAKLAPLAYAGMTKRKPIMRYKGMLIFMAPMTKAEVAEIHAAIPHYINDFCDQAGSFYHAYLIKQKLTVDDRSPRAVPISPEEIEAVRSKLSGIQHNPSRKRLSA